MNVIRYTVDPLSIVPSMPQDIDHLVVKWNGLWCQDVDGGKTVLAFKSRADADGFEKELAGSTPPAQNTAIDNIEGAVTAIRVSQEALYWLSEFGDRLTESSVIDVRVASGRPGFKEADKFLQKAFKEALPGIVAAAIVKAKAQDVEARKVLREEGPKA